MAEPRDTINSMTLEELQGIQEETPEPIQTPLTSQLVRDIVTALIDVEEHNGYRGIAKTYGVLVRQIKLIDRIRLARIAELTPEVIEELMGELGKVK